MAASESFIETVARDELAGAFKEVVRARRIALFLAAMLALVHVVTVLPHVELTAQVTDLERELDARRKALAPVEAVLKLEIERLNEAGRLVADRLEMLSQGAVAVMRAKFDQLGCHARTGGECRIVEVKLRRDAAIRRREATLAPETDPRATGGDALGAPSNAQGQPAYVQGADANARAGRLLDELGCESKPQSVSVRTLDAAASVPDDFLAQLRKLGAAGKREQAFDLLGRYVAPYARTYIVGHEYRRVLEKWDECLRRDYVDQLHASEAALTQAAESMSSLASGFLSAAARDLGREKRRIDEVELGESAAMAAALEDECWSTVSRKLECTDRVIETIRDELRASAVLGRSQSAIGVVVAELEGRKREVESQLKAVESQIEAQTKQLDALTGMSGLLPLTPGLFVQLFPLVLGLVLSVGLGRVADARMRSAQALRDFVAETKDPGNAPAWFVWRLRGRRSLREAVASKLVQVMVLLAWCGAAAFHAGGNAELSLLTPLTAYCAAATLIVVAAAWDIAALRYITQVAPDAAVSDPPPVGATAAGRKSSP